MFAKECSYMIFPFWKISLRLLFSIMLKSLLVNFLCQENIFDVANFSVVIISFILGSLVLIWKDMDHMYFWSSGQSVKLMLNYFQIMTGTPASIIYFLNVLFWLPVLFQKHLLLNHFLSFCTQISKEKHDVIIQNSQNKSRPFDSCLSFHPVLKFVTFNAGKSVQPPSHV
jgi:hypothetical protein